MVDFRMSRPDLKICDIDRSYGFVYNKLSFKTEIF
ncbi:hypothetical protein BJV41_002922 [Clostridium beijerinckii]|nr:hypothetical protein [Clostridium beijerinckii]